MREKTNSIDTVFAASLLCVFAASVLMVLLLGTRIYNSMSSASDLAYQDRISMSYIAEKLRHADKTGAVYVGEFDGINAIYLETEDRETTYQTILYYYDGWLCELFCEKGSEFQKTDGTKITHAEAVHFSEAGSGLFDVEVIDLSGNTSHLTIYLRSGG
ncbi:MAG: hypothetical protein K0S60_764 [Evtepia sp.]|jgi:hypothetical protein|nr:hypothetical protein [Evtepia sp.]